MRLEADVALIHIAGGGGRTTAPPGALAKAPAKRSARGRAEDLLFVTVSLSGAQTEASSLADQLSENAAEAYYKSAGSVTKAIRESIDTINKRLIEINKEKQSQTPLQGNVLIGVLRGENFYGGQSGTGQIILVRSGQLARLQGSQAEKKPLGTSLAAQVQFQHLQIQPNDYIALTTKQEPQWVDSTLSGLSQMSLHQATDHLITTCQNDLTGILIRIVPTGEAVAPAPIGAPSSGKPDTVVSETITSREEVEGSRSSRSTEKAGLLKGGLLASGLAQLRRATKSFFSKLPYGITTLLARMMPGAAKPPSPGTLSNTLLAGTAVAVPIIVVAVSSVIYFRIGRVNQFETYLEQARSSVAYAITNPDQASAREDWNSAAQWLEMAESYRTTDETEALNEQIQNAVDSINFVQRLPFQPVVNGGFNPQAEINALAATSTDLYVLDKNTQTIWHAWSTGRGYDIDREFQCLSGEASAAGMGDPVDLAIQYEPGALGVEGVVAIDRKGSLLYCAPNRVPLTGQLSPPDTGWGRIQAIDVFNEQLYVLDPPSNAVWIYDATDGLFSGNAGLYYVEDVPDLSDAIDLAMAQDELIVLHEDASITRCRRTVDNAPDGSIRIRVECDPNPLFEDQRPGIAASATIPNAKPISVVYSPPPEPSLYFLDPENESIYQYSMRLVYQAQHLPEVPWEEAPTAITIGPPNDLFIASGNQVYFAQPSR